MEVEGGAKGDSDSEDEHINKSHDLSIYTHHKVVNMRMQRISMCIYPSYLCLFEYDGYNIPDAKSVDYFYNRFTDWWGYLYGRSGRTFGECFGDCEGEDAGDGNVFNK